MLCRYIVIIILFVTTTAIKTLSAAIAPIGARILTPLEPAIWSLCTAVRARICASPPLLLPTPQKDLDDPMIQEALAWRESDYAGVITSPNYQFATDVMSVLRPHFIVKYDTVAQNYAAMLLHSTSTYTPHRHDIIRAAKLFFSTPSIGRLPYLWKKDFRRPFDLPRTLLTKTNEEWKNRFVTQHNAMATSYPGPDECHIANLAYAYTLSRAASSQETAVHPALAVPNCLMDALSPTNTKRDTPWIITLSSTHKRAILPWMAAWWQLLAGSEAQHIRSIIKNTVPEEKLRHYCQSTPHDDTIVQNILEDYPHIRSEFGHEHPLRPCLDSRTQIEATLEEVAVRTATSFHFDEWKETTEILKNFILPPAASNSNVFEHFASPASLYRRKPTFATKSTIFGNKPFDHFLRNCRTPNTLENKVFGDALTPTITALSACQSVQRLANIDQSGAVTVVRPVIPMSRLLHSTGVAFITAQLLLQHPFTDKDNAEAVCAGFLHDLSHGPMSHTLDWLKGNRDQQDHAHEAFLLSRGDVVATLKRNGFSPERVANYQYLPIDAPRGELCADRIEYNIMTACHLGWLSRAKAQHLLASLTWDGTCISCDEESARYYFFTSIILSISMWSSPENDWVNHTFSQLLKVMQENDLLPDLDAPSGPSIRGMNDTQLILEIERARRTHAQLIEPIIREFSKGVTQHYLTSSKAEFARMQRIRKNRMINAHITDTDDGQGGKLRLFDLHPRLKELSDIIWTHVQQSDIGVSYLETYIAPPHVDTFPPNDAPEKASWRAATPGAKCNPLREALMHGSCTAAEALDLQRCLNKYPERSLPQTCDQMHTHIRTALAQQRREETEDK